MEYTYRYM